MEATKATAKNIVTLPSGLVVRITPCQFGLEAIPVDKREWLTERDYRDFDDLLLSTAFDPEQREIERQWAEHCAALA